MNLADAIRSALRAGIGGCMVALLALAASITLQDRAWAQQSSAAQDAVPRGVAAADLEQLLATIEDDQRRAELARTLRALLATLRGAETKEAEAGLAARLMADISDRIEVASEAISEAAAIAARAPEIVDWATEQIDNPSARQRWLHPLWQIAAILILGAVATWITRRIVARPLAYLANRDRERLLLRALFLLGTLALDILPTVAFGASAYAILFAIAPQRSAQVLALTVINANLMVQLLLVIGRGILALRAPNLRFLPLKDETATYAYIWLVRFVVVTIYGWMTAEAALVLGFGVDFGNAIHRLAGLVVASMATIVILQNRIAVAEALRGWQAPTPATTTGVARRRIAEIWHVLAIGYVAAAYSVWALGVKQGFGFLLRATALTAVVLALGRLAEIAINRAISRGFSVSEDFRARFPGIEDRTNRYLAVIERILRIAVYVIAGLALLDVWGLDAFGWIGTALGRRVIAGAASIALFVILALVIWEVSRAVIERTLSDGRTASVRARTLLPLLRTVIRVVLVVLVALVALSTIGIDITPILAGAGVVGIAVGFGAQTLVKDVITGWFILMEDQVAVGDMVRIGNQAGIVEAVTIRTVRLRDFDGTVRIIPFSEVRVVENMTKDYSRYVFDVHIAYDEDVDRVIDVLKTLGAELARDETYGPLIVEPLEVVGIDAFQSSAVVIKARITTKPNRHLDVGREFNRRMKRRFDEVGIEIPFPHRTIYVRSESPAAGPTPQSAG